MFEDILDWFKEKTADFLEMANFMVVPITMVISVLLLAGFAIYMIVDLFDIKCYSVECINEISYIKTDRAITVMVDKNGKPVQCKEEK